MVVYVHILHPPCHHCCSNPRYYFVQKGHTENLLASCPHLCQAQPLKSQIQYLQYLQPVPNGQSSIVELSVSDYFYSTEDWCVSIMHTFDSFLSMSSVQVYLYIYIIKKNVTSQFFYLPCGSNDEVHTSYIQHVEYNHAHIFVFHSF